MSKILVAGAGGAPRSAQRRAGGAGLGRPAGVDPAHGCARALPRCAADEYPAGHG